MAFASFAITIAVFLSSLGAAGGRVALSMGSLAESSLRAGRLRTADALEAQLSHEPARNRTIKSKPREAPPGHEGHALAGRRARAPKNVTQFLLSVPGRYDHIAYEVEYNGIVEQIGTLPMRRPRTVNLGMATVKTWLADMIVQLTDVRGKLDRGIDWNRSAAFAAFGFLYIGLVQWVLYVSVMTSLCPNAISFSNEPLEAKWHNVPGLIDLVKQVMIDNCVFEVLIYFPVFYVIKEFVAGHSEQPVTEGLRKYKHNFFSDNMLSMVFWIPGDCFAFAAPIFLRLPIDHTVSFVWTMVLSYRRGAAAAPAKPA